MPCIFAKRDKESKTRNCNMPAVSLVPATSFYCHWGKVAHLSSLLLLPVEPYELATATARAETARKRAVFVKRATAALS
eukprot:2524263-Amphidinium_carterae.1